MTINLSCREGPPPYCVNFLIDRRISISWYDSLSISHLKRVHLNIVWTFSLMDGYRNLRTILYQSLSHIERVDLHIVTDIKILVFIDLHDSLLQDTSDDKIIMISIKCSTLWVFLFQSQKFVLVSLIAVNSIVYTCILHSWLSFHINLSRWHEKNLSWAYSIFFAFEFFSGVL